MDNRFYFQQIRNSAKIRNCVIVQGCCAPEFMDDRDLDVYVVQDDKQVKIKAEYTITMAPLYLRARINKKNISKLLSISIPFSNMAVDEKDKVYVGVVDKKTGAKQKIYETTVSKVRACINDINYAIDSVATDDKNIIIKGRVIDSRKVDIKVTYRGTDTEVDVPVEVMWHERVDLQATFADCPEDKKVGFLVKIEKDPEKMDLHFMADDIDVIHKIKGFFGSEKLQFINTFYVYYQKGVESLKKNGIKATWTKTIHRLFFRNKDYKKWLKKYMPKAKDFKYQRTVEFDYNPKFSVVVPLYETDEKFLNELVESLQNQTYSNWELCFSDGSPDSSRLKDIVGAMTAQDERIKYIAEEKGPLGISENTNQALKIATGDYIVLGDHDDLFTYDALYECVKVLNEKKVDVIYTDEDKVDMKGKFFFDPHFKPDFNLGFLRSNNYICHMFVAAKALVDKVGPFKGEYNGAQDFDFILRCVEQADAVVHIPKILYHWRAHSGSTASAPEVKMYAYEAGKKAVEDHYKRLGIDANVEISEFLGYYKSTFPVKDNPLVSIIIPNKDHVEDLDKCVESIKAKTDYDNYEIVIVENNSKSLDTFVHYKKYENSPNIRVVNWGKDFNYSAINNFGVKEAKGDYLLFLNNDIEVVSPEWLSHMLGYCQHKDVGAVGARLYYPDDTIQHVGVILGMGGVAGHAFSGLYEEEVYRAKSKFVSDYSAVTAACMMVSRKYFEELGGFDETLAVSFNDIDLCLRLKKLGKRIVYNPYAILYHYESKSRGSENTPEKQQRFEKEKEIFMERWGYVIRKGDPCYNPNLTLERQDFTYKK